MRAWIIHRGAVLLRIPRLKIPPVVIVSGRQFRSKGEFHVTLLNTARTEELGGPRIEAALHALRFSVRFTSRGGAEWWTAEEGEAATIIRMCHVENADLFYERLGIEPPPLHVTLYTSQSPRGIGIASHEDLLRLCRPLTDDELASVGSMR